MLNQIWAEARAILEERSDSTVYCGWGVYLDTLISDYLRAGGSWSLVKKVLRKVS